MKLVFTKAKVRKRRYSTISKKQSEAGKDALKKLNDFLDEESPQAAAFVHSLYDNQRKAITYKELREAVVNGHMSMSTLRAWQGDYSRFVTNNLEPLWISAMQKSAENLIENHNGFFFDPAQKGVQNWIKLNGARFVKNQSEESRQALQAMLGYSTTGAYTVDELAQAIRPVIGLTKPQAKANLRYYRKVKEELAKSNPSMRPATVKKKAREAALKYAEKQHRYRADTIAQTELAFAYNHGMDEAVKQAYALGLVGKMARKWITAHDGGVCDMCIRLDGVEVDMDKSFDIPAKPLFQGAHETPPAHPRCRCAVEYVELEPPRLTQGTNEYAEVERPRLNQNTVDILNNDDIIIDEMGSLSANGYSYDFVEPHKPYKIIGKIDFYDTAKVIEVIRLFEKAAVNEKIETALVITKGNTAYKCYGTENRVFPDRDLGDKLIGAVVSHNHPIKETVYSFSEDDLKFFIEYRLERLRGFDELYTYEFTWGEDDIDEPLEDWRTLEDFWHCQMIELSKKLRIGYRRWNNE